MKKLTEKEVTDSFENNLAFMEQVLPVQESFDIIRRDIVIGGREASFYFIDGFTKDEVMLKILDSVMKLKPEEMPERAFEFSQNCLP